MLVGISSATRVGLAPLRMDSYFTTHNKPIFHTRVSIPPPPSISYPRTAKTLNILTLKAKKTRAYLEIMAGDKERVRE